MMEEFIQKKKAFLGRGWTYPPTFFKTNVFEEGALNEKGALQMVEAEEDIQQSLQVLFETLPGERIMEPTYGCDLREMLFEPMDTTFTAYIEDLIATAVLLHESRIDLDTVSVVPNNQGEGRVDILLEYTVRSTNSRFNFVFPFYKKEGTGVNR